MKYFKELNGGRLVCLLCSHYCKLKKNQTGICGVNQNTNKKIECLVYGYIDALNIDPIEKKPLYHFLPGTKSLSLGTVGCNFKCDFCQNHTLSQRYNFSKENYFDAKSIVNLALKHQCKTISFTYNEPTIFYPYAKQIALYAKKHDIKSIFVSNGFFSKELTNDMVGVIDAFNIDLKSFNHRYYKKSLGGRLDEILQNIITLVKQNVHVEITTLIVPTQNDSKKELEDIVNFIKDYLRLDTPWHISAFYPNYKKMNLPKTSIDSLLDAYTLAKKVGLEYVYIGNASIENPTICPSCKRVLIQRNHFNVSKNLIKNNCCSYCKTKIKGVFDE